MNQTQSPGSAPASPPPAGGSDAPTDRVVLRASGLHPSALHAEAFWGTDPGRTRDHNEDSISGTPFDYGPAVSRGYLFMVADGMGGHNAGEIASSEAVKRVYSRYYADADPDLYRSLERAMRTTNNELYHQAQADPAQQGMGTTMTAALIQDNHLIVAHVGDSRLYLVRGGKIELITRDHSWVEDQVRAGVLTRAQAAGHPQRNVITRALATGPDVQVDREERDLQPGDVLVYGSDGLNTAVSDAQIAAHATEASSAAEAVQRLIQLANENGGEDNISVGVIRIPGAADRAAGGAAAAPRDKRPMIAIIVGAALLALIAGLVWAGSSLLGRGGGPAVTVTVATSPGLRPPAGESTVTQAARSIASTPMAATLTMTPGLPTVTLQPTHTAVAANVPTFQRSNVPASATPTKQAKKPAPVLLSPASGAAEADPSVTLAWEPAPGTSLRASEGYAILLWAKGGPDEGNVGLDLPALNDACKLGKPYTATRFSAPMQGKGDLTYRWVAIIVDTAQPEPREKCAVVSEAPIPFEFSYQESRSKPSEKPSPTP